MIGGNIHRAWVFAALLLLLSTAPFAVAQEKQLEKDTKVGELTIELPADPAEPEAAAEQEAPRVRAAKLPVRTLTVGAESRRLDWQAEYRREPTVDASKKLDGNGLSPSAQETLAVARAKGYSREQCIKDLTETASDPEGLVNRSLDVGRHEVVKAMYARALFLTRRELEAKKKSPLRKIVTVNSGGTGDYTRDQDVTCFAGDPSQEEIFFRNLAAAAGELGLTVEQKKSGVDFPQIEVTVFRGGNDLPDSRFATDVREFQLRYTEGIARQILDPESYIGGGADIEVKGKRRPGQIHAQELRIGDNGRISYRSEIPGNTRETSAIFSGTAPERFANWQLSAHIFNNFLQGYRHSKHPGQFTKGSLKYTGRAIERLCQLHGKLPWADLPHEEKLELLARVYPHLDPKTEHGEKALTGMARVIDVADYVKNNKELPGDCRNPETAARAAQIFLRRAVETTSREMARQMLDPPDFEAKWITGAERDRFEAMNPSERFEYLAKRKQTYRECVSVEAMENLVVTMAMLRQIDTEEGIGSKTHGEAAIRRIIDNAEPSLRPILEDLGDYSRLYLDLHLTSDPQEREKARGDLAETRQRIGRTLGEEAPGLRILEEMERMGPQEYLKREMETGRCPGPGMAEVKARFAQHIREAFPSFRDEYKMYQVRRQALGGMGGYIARKVRDEVCQLDTIADGLQVIEMYQNGAGYGDYLYFGTVNVLSRFHWSFSHFIAAGQMFWIDGPDAQTKKWEAAECLAKNLIFTTFARVIPWAATAKVVFDIARGIVTVTVGYSINVVNADLVDAMYTGEAGRMNDQAAGSMVGRIRDSGFCVLPEAFVVKARDEKTGEPFLWIDRTAAYRFFFKQWTGLEAHELPKFGVREAARNPALVRANDNLAKLFYRQAEKYDRVWVSTAKRKRITLMVTASEVEEAILELNRQINIQARQAVRKVLSESAVRSYRSIFQKEGVDVIEEGLTARLTADVLTGMMEFWESYITAQVLAMRDIERSAMLADMSALGGVLGKAIQERIREKPEREPEFQCEIDVKLFGELDPETREFDARVPVRVSAFLHGSGEVGEHQQTVKFEVVASNTEVIEEATGKKGALLGETIRVRALANRGAGPVLAESPELSFLVRKPPEKDGAVKKVPIFKREERRRDGSLYLIYTWIQAFSGMPGDWYAEYGQVIHGKLEEYDREDHLSNDRVYRYGILAGPWRDYDSKGRLVHECVYRGEEKHGPEVNYDPDSRARLETDWVNDEIVARRGFRENGGKAVEVTFLWESDPETGYPVATGEFQSWHASGSQECKGRFERSEVFLDDRKVQYAHSYQRKVGVWEYFHPDGSPSRRETWEAGVLHGPFELMFPGGQVERRGRYRQGIPDGRWEYYFENGRLMEAGNLVADVKDGSWESYFENGQLKEKLTYVEGRLNGPSEYYWESGGLCAGGNLEDGDREGAWIHQDEDGNFEKGIYRDGRKHGNWVAKQADGRYRYQRQYRDGIEHGVCTNYHINGKVEESGRYRDGIRTGRWETYREDGKRKGWVIYDDEGDVTGGGTYDD